MEATSDFKNMIKSLFKALEPEGKGKVHKDTLKKSMKDMLLGKKIDDEALDKMIECMGADKDGNISANSYLKLFSMPEFSAEEAAATRRVLKECPDFLGGLIDSKGVAARIGFNQPEEVDKIVNQLKNCYLENLDQRLKKEPPKSKKVMEEKKAQLMRAVGDQPGAQGKKKSH